MKKDITYYLEDTSRLGEISQTELDTWIAEMPFHQPLQMLAGIKAEMDGPKTDSHPKVYAAYFAVDFESTKKVKSRKNNQRNKNTKQLAKTIDILPQSAIDSEKGSLKEEVKTSPVIVHRLADDVLEEGIDRELSEELEVSVKGEISSDLANDAMEDEVLSEVLEENIGIDSPPTSDLVVVDPELEEEQVSAEDISEDTDDKTAKITNEPGEENKVSKVDYAKYADVISEDQVVSDGIISTNEDIQEDTEAKDEKVIAAVDSVESSKKKSKSKKKKKDSKKKKEKRKKEKKTKEKKIKKDKKAKQKDSKKKTKKGKIKKKKIKIKSERIVDKSKKRKKGKTEKSSKGEKKIAYVIVDSSEEKNFKLKDYDGVSSYTSWLLEQESINGTKGESNKNAHPEMKKVKKKKSKKKKKKSKSLKLAVDSVKKQDSIISEPLANILAIQGHKKKAKKMYQKLARVFPEKKAHFDEKINALKL